MEDAQVDVDDYVVNTKKEYKRPKKLEIIADDTDSERGLG